MQRSVSGCRLLLLEREGLHYPWWVERHYQELRIFASTGSVSLTSRYSSLKARVFFGSSLECQIGR